MGPRSEVMTSDLMKIMICVTNVQEMLSRNFTLNLIVILDGNRETVLLGWNKLQFYKEIHAPRK